MDEALPLPIRQMRDVDHYHRTDLVCNLAKRLSIDLTRIGTVSGDDHLGTVAGPTRRLRHSLYADRIHARRRESP